MLLTNITSVCSLLLQYWFRLLIGFHQHSSTFQAFRSIDSGFETGEAGFLDTGLEFQVILEIPEFPEILVSRYYMWCGFWQAGPI